MVFLMPADAADTADKRRCRRHDGSAETGIPMEKLPLALNARLPRDISVCGAEIVPEDFHAVFSCTVPALSAALLCTP